MARCSFCGKNIQRGTGILFVRKTGKILYFCSTKCQKNLLKLGRKPSDYKWTRAYGKEAKGAKEE
ncbi:50S ribosomal protein L24e [Candidatus Woesearchaeota archaeon CG07_land_8_20_14_0_80_44_23]|jgi:large subunit ribosomal protein L24e|nr:MAG: 50S ribosomal protein L24e [Candidatus Woesearchaeota archaeon CG07_land_8_20_14_0_80_44_23]